MSQLDFSFHFEDASIFKASASKFYFSKIKNTKKKNQLPIAQTSKKKR